MECLTRAGLVAAFLFTVPCYAAPAKPARTGSGAGAGKPASVAAPAKPAKPASPLANGKTYTHPAGASLRYPANWTLQEGEGFLQIIPPDQGRNEQGPTEAYLVLGEAAGPITDPRDPRVLEQADNAVTSLMPFLKRSGAPEEARTASGKGIKLTWSGTNPAGKEILAQGYVAILNGFAVSVLALGEKARLTPRAATVQAIFESISTKTGETDAALVGTWHMLKDGGQLIRDAGGKVTTSTASDRNITYQLSADGSFVMVEKSHFIAGSNGVFIDSGPTTETKRGRWNGSGGKLFLQWDDGSSSTHQYRMMNGKLVVDETSVFSRQ